MAFSVLMSVYYKEKAEFLDRALKSNIENQTLSPNQFVLVCDGPLTAELDSVIEKYQGKHPSVFTVLRLEKNVGLGKALNYGLQACKYDLIARSDSDDVCLPDRFEKQIAYMADHPEVSASSGAIDEFEDDYDQPIRRKNMPLSHEELLKYGKSRCPLNHMAVIFRKQAVLEVGSYEHLQYLEDYYLWMRLIANGYKIGNSDSLLVHACVGNGMVERRGDKRYIQSWKTLGKYMLKNKLQSPIGYIVSIAKVSVWCYMPGSFRTFVYNKILRK